MREALIRLEERGYVHRTQGARTSPNRRLPGVGRRIDQQFDHSLSIRAAGYDATLDLVSSERTSLVPGIHRFDDLPDGTSVLRTVKMWRVDGAPYALAEDLVPLVHEVELDPHRPVFDLAEAANGVRVAWETMWIEATGLDAERAALLSAEAGDAGHRDDLLRVRRRRCDRLLVARGAAARSPGPAQRADPPRAVLNGGRPLGADFGGVTAS